MRYAPFFLAFLAVGLVACDSAVQEPADPGMYETPAFAWNPSATNDTIFPVTSDVHLTVVTDGPFSFDAWDRGEIRLQHELDDGHVMVQSDGTDGNNGPYKAATTVLVCVVNGGPNAEVYMTVPRGATVTHRSGACTAGDALEALISEVQQLNTAGVLDDGLANSLLSKLTSADKSIAADRPSAANQLGAFINELEGNKNIRFTPGS